MENETYLATISGLSTLLGRPQLLTSGNGARFTSATKGKVTVYHRDIAAGNQTEVAFHIVSMAHRLGTSESEFRALVQVWKQQTGRSVQMNQQYIWPRVGLSSPEQAATLITLIQSRIE
ncbi:hypothetical protein [Propionivibrio sp.]|uniref:hypothetical protein n=1 Tax=Propionivibrio sp. TaxID=2212460 RepID=UPI0039E549B5